MIRQRRGAREDARRDDGPANVLRACVASIVFCAVACSSPMDVVATYDPGDQTPNAASATSSNLDEIGEATARTVAARLVIAGQPMPNWRGATFSWPLEERLSELFSERDEPQRTKKGHTSSFQKAVEREVVFVDGADADRLLELFSRAPTDPGEEPSLIVRDEFNDRYFVVFEALCNMGEDPTGMQCIDAAELGNLD